MSPFVQFANGFFQFFVKLGPKVPAPRRGINIILSAFRRPAALQRVPYQPFGVLSCASTFFDQQSCRFLVFVYSGVPLNGGSMLLSTPH